MKQPIGILRFFDSKTYGNTKRQVDVKVLEKEHVEFIGLLVYGKKILDILAKY